MHINMLSRLALLSLLALSASQSWAELPGIHPLLNKKFTIGAGGFFPDVDSKIRLDSDLGPGTPD